MSDRDKGFASMSKKKQREIDSKGGQSSHKSNKNDEDRNNRNKNSDNSWSKSNNK